MAVSTQALTRSRRLIMPGQLGAVLVGLAVAVTLVYRWQAVELPAPTAGQLSASAIENSRAFVREQAAVEPAEIFASGAYIRELPAASPGLSAAAIGSSWAFAREQAAPRTQIFGSGAYIREFAATSTVTVTPEMLGRAGAHVREQGSADPRSMGLPTSWAHVREAPN